MSGRADVFRPVPVRDLGSIGDTSRLNLRGEFRHLQAAMRGVLGLELSDADFPNSGLSILVQVDKRALKEILVSRGLRLSPIPEMPHVLVLHGHSENVLPPKGRICMTNLDGDEYVLFVAPEPVEGAVG